MALKSWLHRETFASPILLMSLLGDSLLVYCADNVLYHFLVVPTTETRGYQSPPRLVQFGQISFRGIIHSPTRVRAMSWILPEEHSRESPDLSVHANRDSWRSIRRCRRCDHRFPSRW